MKSFIDYLTRSRDVKKSSRKSRVKSLIQSQANLKPADKVDTNLSIKTFDDSMKQNPCEEQKLNDTPYEESEHLTKSSQNFRSKSKDRKLKENGISKSM